MSTEKDFKKAKKTFEKLKLDPSSSAFAATQITKIKVCSRQELF